MSPAKAADSPRQARRKAPKKKPKIKVINLRERVRILQNVLIWSEQGFVREAERHRDKIKKLVKDNVLRRANARQMKRAFSLELVRQRGVNQQVQQDIFNMRVGEAGSRGRES